MDESLWSFSVVQVTCPSIFVVAVMARFAMIGDTENNSIYSTMTSLGLSAVGSAATWLRRCGFPRHALLFRVPGEHQDLPPTQLGLRYLPTV